MRTIKKRFSGWNIDRLKMAIWRQEGIHVIQQRFLIKNGRRLDDSELVGDLFENGDTVALIADIHVWIRGATTGNLALLRIGTDRGNDTVDQVTSATYNLSENKKEIGRCFRLKLNTTFPFHVATLRVIRRIGGGGRLLIKYHGVP